MPAVYGKKKAVGARSAAAKWRDVSLEDSPEGKENKGPAKGAKANSGNENRPTTKGVTLKAKKKVVESSESESESSSESSSSSSSSSASSSESEPPSPKRPIAKPKPAPPKPAAAKQLPKLAKLPYRTARAAAAAALPARDSDESASTDAKAKDSSYAESNSMKDSDESFELERGKNAEKAGLGLREQIARKTVGNQPGPVNPVKSAPAKAPAKPGASNAPARKAKIKLVPARAPTGRPLASAADKPNPAARLKRAPSPPTSPDTPEPPRTTTNILDDPNNVPVIEPIPTPDSAPPSGLPTDPISPTCQPTTSTPAASQRTLDMQSPDFSPILSLSSPPDASATLASNLSALSLSSNPANRSVSPIHVTRRPNRLNADAEPPSVYKTTFANKFRDAVDPRSSRKCVSVGSPSSARDLSMSRDNTFDSFITAEEEERKVGLDEVLKVCGQGEAMDWEDGLNWVDEAGTRHSLLPALRKIGEATYSEVFSCPLPSRDRRRTGTRELVVKILPFLGGPGLDIDEAGEKVLVNGCGMLEPLAVWTEIACCTRLSRVGSGLFGGFHRARVVKGSYPIELIREWNKWDSEKKRQGGEGSENWEPDYFPPHQHFVLIFLPFEGTDLELFPLPKWVHAESVFVQVTMALAAAERECGFEHRDLHAGNILLLDTASDDPIEWTDTSASVRYEFNRKGPKATVIDYTLSRFEDGGQLFYNPLEDEDIFNGEGDEQYEVYRRMRKATNGDWRGFWGVTNVIWLGYLLHKLLREKNLVAPRPKDKRNRAVKDYPAEKAAFDRLNALDKSIAKYASAWDVFDAIWEASGLLERVEN